MPLGVTIAPGSWNDARLATVTIEHAHPHTILAGALLLADRGYDSFEFRSYLSWKGLASNYSQASNNTRWRASALSL
jgi:hypothetical protein